MEICFRKRINSADDLSQKPRAENPSTSHPNPISTHSDDLTDKTQQVRYSTYLLQTAWICCWSSQRTKKHTHKNCRCLFTVAYVTGTLHWRLWWKLPLIQKQVILCLWYTANCYTVACATFHLLSCAETAHDWYMRKNTAEARYRAECREQENQCW